MLYLGKDDYGRDVWFDQDCLLNLYCSIEYLESDCTTEPATKTDRAGEQGFEVGFRRDREIFR